jgi:hypothetical protein
MLQLVAEHVTLSQEAPLQLAEQLFASHRTSLHEPLLQLTVLDIAFAVIRPRHEVFPLQLAVQLSESQSMPPAHDCAPLQLTLLLLSAPPRT